jgi:iron complex outermembrane receptor protein
MPIVSVHPRALTPVAQALLALAVSLSAQAQSPNAAPLQTIVVTGNPLRSEAPTTPVASLAGDELALRGAASLGDTLDGLPGVAATRFGPGASRPVIRGLDGERVRVLANSGATLDASALSFDHAVPIEPMLAERIEVLRGPAALLYGGGAIGGVVNVIDNRVPRRPASGFSGAVELRRDGTAAGRAGVLMLEGGDRRSAWHSDLALRDAGELRVPRFEPMQDGTALPATERVRNSDARAQSGAFGASVFLDEWRLGAAFDRQRNAYGVVAEPDVRIDMHRNQLRLESEWTPRATSIRALRAQALLADYEHREIEGGGEVGTTFSHRGGELRVEAVHRRLGFLEGTLGLQIERGRFSALGEEAFVPSTRSEREGLFLLEEASFGPSTTALGLRHERASVASRGDADPDVVRFGAAQERRFSLSSLSLSQRFALGAGWALAGQASRNERAPSAAELFANGVHAATGTYERGDSTLPAERGRAWELALERRVAGSHLRVAAWQARFGRYLGLIDSGLVVDEEGTPVPADTPDAVPLFRFEAVRARLNGVEVDWEQRLVLGGMALQVRAGYDRTRADDLTHGEPLPRIAPERLRAGLTLARGAWQWRLDLTRLARQDRVPATDSATPGATLVDLGLAWRGAWAGREALVWLKLGNAGDRLAKNASTFETVRQLAPLPGRALSAGLRMAI